MTRADHQWLYQWVDAKACRDHFLDDMRDLCSYPVPDPDAPALSEYGHMWRDEFAGDVRCYVHDLQTLARQSPVRFAAKLWHDVNGWSADHSGGLPDGFDFGDATRLTRIISDARLETMVTARTGGGHDWI